MTFRATMRALVPAFVVVGSLVLVGCGSSGAPRATSTSTSTSASSGASTAPGEDTTLPGPIAPSGFRSVIITITHPDGSTTEHCVWIADDRPSQAQGLMGVTDPGLGGRAGMVFRFPGEVSTSFWMKDTPLPLSIAWFDASGLFVSSADMSPCPAGEPRCPRYSAAGPYQYALEVPEGTLNALGVGDRSRIALGRHCE